MGIIGSWEGRVISPYTIFDGTYKNEADNTGGATGVLITGGSEDVMVQKIYLSNLSTLVMRMYVARKYDSTNPNQIASIRLNKAFNLATYDYLKVSYELLSGTERIVKIGVHTASNATSYISHVSNKAYRGELILDIKNLSGNHFIYVEIFTKHMVDGFFPVIDITKIELTSQ